MSNTNTSSVFLKEFSPNILRMLNLMIMTIMIHPTILQTNHIHHTLENVKLDIDALNIQMKSLNAVN